MKGRLYKSNKDKTILGVCGGLAQYLEMDSSIIRILWVIASVVSDGLGIFLYFLLGIILPEEDKIEDGIPYSSQEESFKKHQDHSKVIGTVLIGLGILFILRKFLRILDFQYIFPIVLIVLGIFLIIRGGKKDHEE